MKIRSNNRSALTYLTAVAIILLLYFVYTSKYESFVSAYISRYRRQLSRGRAAEPFASTFRETYRTVCSGTIGIAVPYTPR